MNSSNVDKAFATVGVAYADQTERGCRALVHTFDGGRVPAIADIT